MQGMSTSGPRWEQAYDVAEFAEKHGLTIAQAKIVITANGPSKHKCDIGAVAFRQALEVRGPRSNPRIKPRS